MANLMLWVLFRFPMTVEGLKTPAEEHLGKRGALL